MLFCAFKLIVQKKTELLVKLTTHINLIHSGFASQRQYVVFIALEHNQLTVRKQQYELHSHGLIPLSVFYSFIKESKIIDHYAYNLLLCWKVQKKLQKKVFLYSGQLNCSNLHLSSPDGSFSFEYLYTLEKTRVTAAGFRLRPSLTHCVSLLVLLLINGADRCHGRR